MEEIKDYSWYVDKYLEKDIVFKSIRLNKDDCAYLKEVFKRYPGMGTFELRIGLLKFICDDLRINFYEQLELLNSKLRNSSPITEVCPKEFILSLFSVDVILCNDNKENHKDNISHYLLYPIKYFLRRKVKRYKHKLEEIRYKQTHYAPKNRRCGMTETMMVMEYYDMVMAGKYERFINRWSL